VSAPQPPDSGDRYNLSRIAIQNPAITIYLLAALLLAGVAAYFQLGQDEDPPFTMRIMVVRAFWPGADAMQMAQQVTDRIERTLQEVPNIDQIRSYAKPGETTVFLEVKDSTPPDEVADTWYTARKKLNDNRGEFPEGMRGPFVNDEFGDVFGVVYALSAADGFTHAELEDQADFVRQELLRVKGVAKVEMYGVQDEKVYVEISRKSSPAWASISATSSRPSTSRTRWNSPAYCARR
jgi:multidrug efflux pump